jgi:kinetochore protein Mis12/MTW1
MAQPPSSQKADHELLTEHFGYPPVSLLDDIINTVNILAESALKSIEQFLSSTPPKSLGFRDAKKSSSSSNHGTAPPPLAAEDAAKFEIDNGTHQLETLLCSSIDRNFDIFELYVMRHLLRIAPEDRPWIKLKHYEGLDFERAAAAAAATPDQETSFPTVTSVNALRRKLRASQRLNVLLQAEKAKNDALLRQLRSLVGGSEAEAAAADEEVMKEDSDGKAAPLEFLRDVGSLAEGDAQTPIRTTTAFTLSQLQALRALSTSLKNMGPDLAEAAGAGGDDDEGGEGASSKRNRTWRSERVGYVEGLTRKHLENVRGLELGSQGEVRDGEWQAEGRKFSKGEVGELEQVASILGGRERDDDDDRMDES